MFALFKIQSALPLILRLTVVLLVITSFESACQAQKNTRIWSDTTGTFSVEAELVKTSATTVTLKKLNGKSIEVPISRLSKFDAEFVAKQIQKSKKKTKPAPGAESETKIVPVKDPPADTPPAKKTESIDKGETKQPVKISNSKPVPTDAATIPVNPQASIPNLPLSQTTGVKPDSELDPKHADAKSELPSGLMDEPQPNATASAEDAPLPAKLPLGPVLNSPLNSTPDPAVNSPGNKTTTPPSDSTENMTPTTNLVSPPKTSTKPPPPKLIQNYLDAKKSESATPPRNSNPLSTAQYREIVNSISDLKNRVAVREGLIKLAANLPVDRDLELIDAIQNVLKNSDARTRALAIDILANYDSLHSWHLIISGMDDPSFNVRSAAYKWIEKTKDPRSIQPLCEKLLTPGGERAAAVLTTFGTQAEPHVIPLLENEAGHIQMLACSLLASVGTEQSFGPLQKAAKESNEVKVRMQARNSIAKIEKRLETATGISQ